MALVQLLQPWADESFHYRGIAMTNQGSGQCHEREQGWSRIVNSSETPE